MMNKWNGGDIVSDEEYDSAMLMYSLIKRIERLEYPCRPPVAPLRPSTRGFIGMDGQEITNEQAIEFNRVGIPKPKEKQRHWFFGG